MVVRFGYLVGDQFGELAAPAIAAPIAGGGLEESGGQLQREALTGDVTAAAGDNALTLATVNANVGTFGSATQVGQFTVNGKGLITAAAAVTVTPAASSITGGNALTKTDDTNVTLTLGGTPATALLAATSLTLGWTGTLGVTRGGTGFGTATQGDLIYADASNSFAKLAKNTTATRYLSNTGTSNNPAWAQVGLTDGVTGTLPVANGGTGATTFTNNRVLTGNGTSAIVDEANLTFNGSTLAVTGDATVSGNAVAGALVATDSPTNFLAGTTNIEFSASASRIQFFNRNGSAYLNGNIDGLAILFRPSGSTSATVDSTGLNMASGKTIRVNGTQVVTARKTGWTAATGTAQRSGFATYTAANISNPPTEAEVQAIADALQDASRTLKAMIDDLHGTAGHGLIGT